MSRHRRSAALAAVIVSAAVLAACGGSTSSSVAPPPSGAVVVEAKDYSFTPATITVPAGEVTFYVRNSGTQEHEFEIFKGEQVVDEIEGLVPGLAKSLKVTLAAGDYTYVCKINGHDQLGMKGTLTVTGS